MQSNDIACANKRSFLQCHSPGVTTYKTLSVSIPPTLWLTWTDVLNYQWLMHNQLFHLCVSPYYNHTNFQRVISTSQARVCLTAVSSVFNDKQWEFIIAVMNNTLFWQPHHDLSLPVTHLSLHYSKRHETAFRTIIMTVHVTSVLCCLPPANHYHAHQKAVLTHNTCWRLLLYNY